MYLNSGSISVYLICVPLIHVRADEQNKRKICSFNSLVRAFVPNYMRFIIVSADREFSARRFPHRSRLYHTDQFHRGSLKKTCLRETTHFSAVTVLRSEELRREWRWDERHL